jgi:hypothetical protein
MRLTASYRWCMVSPGALRGMPDSLHQRLAFYPDPRIFGNRVVVVLTGASHRVFRSTLQGLNQSIVSLSPYLRLLTPLAMRSLMMEVHEYYARLIVWYNFSVLDGQFSKA